MIWFTADHHFGHENIIKHCHRGFPGADAMDETLVARWNEVVGPDDTVWHLGDFCFRGRPAEHYLARLHGREKHLIWGNHDDQQTRHARPWSSSQPMAEIKVDGRHIVLCHYALRVWNRSHHGALHLFGHTHGRLPDTESSCDVGVDCWGFRPVALTDILARLGAPRCFG